LVTGLPSGDHPDDASGKIEETPTERGPSSPEQRDQAGERRDQAGGRRDRVGHRRDRAGEQRDQAGERRDAAGARRDTAGDARDHIAGERDGEAAQRDAARCDRDEAAARRDRAAELDGSSVGDSITSEFLERRIRSRDAAASDRVRASQDRHAAAGERDEAERDRRSARADRRAGAGERADAQRDRDSALNDRRAGAGERGNAWLDRDTALADRGAGANERSAAELDRETAMADRGASAVELEHSSHDALTGAYLRGAGFAELERDIGRARRDDQPLVLAFVDVDGLKAANDTQGHAAGDRMLRAVADALRAKLRAHDLIIRYGGDEFVCAVSGLHADEAAARLRLVNVALAALPEHASVTVGIAEMASDDQPDDLIARADAALYSERERR
jgi:diguanylate cyclase (GGDEF)-like protein